MPAPPACSNLSRRRIRKDQNYSGTRRLFDLNRYSRYENPNLAFTRRAATEIVERVKMHLGDAARGLNASTFHAWCMHLIHRAPQTFGCKGSTVIDEDDQLQLFKRVRGARQLNDLPESKKIRDLYSLARNTLKASIPLSRNTQPIYEHKKAIAE